MSIRDHVFLKSMARLFSLQVLGLGCGFIVHLILARFLGAAEYGVYSFIFSLAVLAALVGNFGFQASSVRLIPQFLVERNEHLLRGFYKFSSLWVALFSIAVGGAVFAVVRQFLSADTYSLSVIVVGVILTPLLALLRLNSGVFKGFKQGAIGLAYESSLKEILFLIVLLALFLCGWSIWNAYAALIIVAAILSVILIVSFVHVGKAMTAQVQQLAEDEAGVSTSEKRPYKDWLYLSLPMMLVISAQVIIHRSDIVVLGLLSDASDVGVYGVGAKLAQAATLGAMVLNIVFSPRASEAFHKGDLLGLRSLYLKTLAGQFISTVMLALGLLVVSGLVLNYLGDAYVYALPVLYVLMGGYVLNALWGPVPFLMIMTKFEYQAMWFTFAAALLNVALNFYLIPIYGIVGAAIATVVSLNLRNAGALAFILSRGMLKNIEGGVRGEA